MTFPKSSRIYLDTSVLIELCLGGNGVFIDECIDFKNDIINNDLKCVVTQLAIIEAISAIKYKRTKKQNGKPPTISEMNAVAEGIDKTIQKLGFELQDICEFDELLQKRACEFLILAQPYYDDYNNLKIIGTADAMHLVLAENAGVNCLLACDKDFKHVTSNVEHKLLQEVY